jgi:hypothetical protein
MSTKYLEGSDEYKKPAELFRGEGFWLTIIPILV